MHRPLTCEACGRLLYANRGFIAQHMQEGKLCPGSGHKPLEARGRCATVRWSRRKGEWKERKLDAKLLEAQERKRATRRLKELVRKLDPQRHRALVERTLEELKSGL